MGLAAFLIVIQSLILLVHWIVFRSMDHYFPLSDGATSFLCWFFLVLSFSFLFSNISTRFFPGTLTRAAYFFAAVWLGTVHFLFMGAVLIALLQLLSDFLVLPIPSGVAYVVYTAAFGLSLISLSRSYDLMVRRETIVLPYLPNEWQGKRIIFFADTHYGNIHREQTAKHVVKLIENENPALVLMGGDFFDGPPINPDLVTAPYQTLTGSTPTFFVSGNHEEYGKKAEFLKSLEQNGFRVINDTKTVLNGLQIVGLDFMTTRTHASTEMTLEHLELDRSLPTIVMKHIPRHIEEIEAAGGHLMLSGHTHRGQMWPASLITWYVYRGYDYGLKVYKNLQVYTTSGAGSWGPPHRLGTQAEIAVLTLERRKE